ncbi:Uncharacterised protein [Candidatus Anstonella stagnisolia]|nr:Uncharacterised protein [Candidatus Anstonella stagnisolia]
MHIMDERLYVAIGMKEQGGSFVKGLGEALLHADMYNTEKIKKAFLGYWKDYLKIGIEIESKKPER